MSRAVRALVPVIVLGLFLALPARAQDLLMVRSALAFPEAMVVLQNSIRDHGYTLSRVQRVDIGLTAMGFKTDKYRVVFFGKLEEQRRLLRQQPDLAAYLPLKIAIFAEGDETLLVTYNPVRWMGGFDRGELHVQFLRWESDLVSILDDVRTAE